MVMKNTGIPWSVPMAVDDIPDSGLHVTLEAPREARSAVAELAGLRDLPALSAVFDLKREGACVHVSGHVAARVGQTCVVTLEPIENTVEEAIDVQFAPASGTESTPARKRGRKDEEPPEPLVGDTLDLGVLATEFLILGMDPYPRQRGAEFAPPKSEDRSEHPFAALQSLKKPPGADQS